VSVSQQAHVTIKGSASDPDGDTLTYLWTQVDGPAVTFADPTALTLQFDAPKVDADTTITVQLVASDPGLSSDPAVVTVKVGRGCGCSSFEGSLIGLVGLLTVLRRRRSR
jgi:MYXO-CTERM domain-containing protein